jgi:hypothetical protein
LLRFWVRPGNNNPVLFSSITKAPEKCYTIKVKETAGKNISERVLAIEVKVA